jgi:tRNA-splicing ligase RtcB
LTATVLTWLPERPNPELAAALDRLARTEGVEKIAVMPDAHVSEDVCVGTVTATRNRIFPACVGGDIGCGMVTLRLGVSAYVLADRHRAARVLDGLARWVPKLVRRSAEAPPLPAELMEAPLSAVALTSMKLRDGRLSFGTLGRGNHFLEVQRDSEGQLWLAVHSGSRAMGPAIRAHHEASTGEASPGLVGLDAESEAGRAYLRDAAWACLYAQKNREALLAAATAVLVDTLSASPEPSTRIECDHNHVRREEHGGRSFWVHRKGAMSLPAGALGILPGSMGSSTFHVEGRGHAESMFSSAHGAGRAMHRTEARRRIHVKQLLSEARGVWFDHRLAEGLREEAPSAYKDIGAVMRAQRELVRVVRRLEPVLVYKAT